jgi:cobalt-zinc-cadmium efflux system outer membrane protein
MKTPMTMTMTTTTTTTRRQVKTPMPTRAAAPRLAAALALAGGLLVAGRVQAEGLSMEQAVAIALQRNRDVIAAKMEIEGTQLDVVAARVYPNPTLEYSVGNLVLGHANPQGSGMVSPGFFGQPIQSVGVTEVVDVWAKRSARIRAAGQGVDHRRLLTEDALREIVYAVRSGFADVVREQSERELSHEVAGRYAETVRISQARFRAGDISEAELRKIELEGLKYQNDVIDADMQLDLARSKLAGLLGFESARELPGERLEEPDARPTYDLTSLTQGALAHRPDLRATAAARGLAGAQLSAARREIYPDLSVGVSYTHDDFTISGDNPNTLALSLSLPVPLFDRNQANVGHARLDLRRADNDAERLRIQIEHEVAESVRKTGRSRTLLEIFEGPPTAGAVQAGGGTLAPTATADKGGMLSRAETALRVAEKSYKAGATSILELLEAQRTYLDTRAQYLRALYDFRQATIDVAHAVGD